jgi:hypothetical protein
LLKPADDTFIIIRRSTGDPVQDFSSKCPCSSISGFVESWGTVGGGASCLSQPLSRQDMLPVYQCRSSIHPRKVMCVTLCHFPLHLLPPVKLYCHVSRGLEIAVIAICASSTNCYHHYLPYMRLPLSASYPHRSLERSHGPFRLE